METIYHELLYPSPVYPANFFDITNGLMKGSSAGQLVCYSNAMIHMLKCQSLFFLVNAFFFFTLIHLLFVNLVNMSM